MDLIARLLAIDVSALSDADKTLPVVDPAVRAMLPDVRIAGPAFTVVAEDDHLPVMSALGEAQPGDVLVIATNGGSRAVFGELVATEANRRGLAGIVADGLCRDLRGLRAIGLPVFARGTTPQAGTAQLARGAVRAASIGGAVAVRGDFVIGDEDGVVIIPADKLDAVLPLAEEIQRSEGAILEAIGQGRDLFAHTNLEEHYQKRGEGLPSTLSVAPPPSP